MPRGAVYGLRALLPCRGWHSRFACGKSHTLHLNVPGVHHTSQMLKNFHSVSDRYSRRVTVLKVGTDLT